MAVTDLLRVEVNAVKAGRNRPLIDTTFSCTTGVFTRWSEVLDRDDLDMVGRWQRAGWDIELKVHDPDQGDDAPPIAHLHLVTPAPASVSVN